MRAHEQDIWDCWWAFCLYTDNYPHIVNSSRMHFEKMNLLSPPLVLMRILQLRFRESVAIGL